MNQKRLDFLMNAAYFFTVSVIAMLVLRFMLPWFWPFLFGLALAYLFRQISRVMRVRGKAAVACVGIAFYLTIVFLFWAVFVLLAGKLVDWAEALPGYVGGRRVGVGPVQTAGDGGDGSDEGGAAQSEGHWRRALGLGAGGDRMGEAERGVHRRQRGELRLAAADHPRGRGEAAV